MKLLGYLAIDKRGGQSLKLTNPSNPRKQLLEKLGRKHADKMYCDLVNGGTRHTGYIVAGGWWEILEVHAWSGGKAI